MNRRKMIALCLAAPAASTSIVVEEKQAQNEVRTAVLSNKTRLVLDLADPEAEAGGITELIVSYKGEQWTISAKQIWEVLQSGAASAAKGCDAK